MGRVQVLFLNINGEYFPLREGIPFTFEQVGLVYWAGTDSVYERLPDGRYEYWGDLRRVSDFDEMLRMDALSDAQARYFESPHTLHPNDV